jgi:DNA-binding transcriptional ArsR family regulator
MSLLDASALDQDLDQLVFLFKLLCDKTRLNILLSLVKGERNVTSLCEELRLPQPTVSHHLGLLRVNNMIANRRRGKQVFYSLHGAVSLIDETTLEINAGKLCLKITRQANSAPVHVSVHHPERAVPSLE